MAKTRRTKRNAQPIKLYQGPNVDAVRISGDTTFNNRRPRKEITFTGVNTGKLYPYASERKGGRSRPASSDFKITPRVFVGAVNPIQASPS